jgi:uncharacterized membrane protein YhhN
MKFRTLLIVFFGALAIEIVSNALNFGAVQFISKPSLMLILIYYFSINAKGLAKERNLIIAALTFSWLGDVVLLVEKQYSWLFAFGLASFLVAHICYVVYFWQMRKINLKGAKMNFIVVFAVLVYSLTFYCILFPHIGVLKIPILMYITVISLMLILSLNAFDLKSQPFGRICVAGTSLFALSDSVLATNRFLLSIKFGSSLVMLFYATSQLLITEGALRNLTGQNIDSNKSK